MLPLLSDITVIEVANTVAPAYAGRLLADLGAEVIAIEPPGGNRLRARGGPAANLADYLSANKRSATIDYEAAPDPSLAEALCRAADIILYDKTSAYLNAHLLERALYRTSPVVCSVITPYGLNSRYASLHGDELLIFSLSGIASITPEEYEDRNAERPMQLAGEQSQFVGGLTAAVSSLQGWYTVRQDGASVLLDISLLDALSSVPIISQAAVFAGHPPPKGPSLRPQTVPRGMLRCRDGYVYTQGGDDNWIGWATLLDRADWREPPFTDSAYREQQWPVLRDAIDRWLGDRTIEDVYRACQGAGITAFPVNSIGQVVDNAQIQARDVFRPVERAVGRPFLAPRTPLRVLSPTFDDRSDIAPLLGADTEWARDVLAVPATT